jgi:serine/threonine protein kinase
MSNERFGRYEIKSELGRGGMATVYHAYDPRFERDVAIKVLPREFLHDAQFRARFEREAKMIALLEHPAIVPVYDFGEEEGQPYIVMRYMSGGSLSERLPKGAFSVEEAVQLIERLAPSLDAAHAKGIVHRDLKPGNILFDQYGNAFLSDFGIARLAQAGTATLTGGNILGTPAYMSPEQVQGDHELDGRSDLYALGVILFQILTGNMPYQSTTPARVMMMHILEPVPNILEVRKELPVVIQTVIEKAMAKDPDHRYPTAGEMAEELSELVGLSSGMRPHTSSPAEKAGAATMVIPQSTQVYPNQAAKTVAGLSPTVMGGPPIGTPAAAVDLPKKKGLPIWLIGLIAVLVLGVIGAGALGAFSALSPKPTATTAALVIPPTSTATPLPASPTVEVVAALPSDTPLPPTVTHTPLPTSTPTQTPSPTSAAAPVLGGADKIAFVSANDIWMMNVDGSELVKLTNDGAEKRELQWGPGGTYIAYISGKCLKTIEVDTGVADVIACYNNVSANSDGSFNFYFEISPDGKKIAISMDNDRLYVVPYDIPALKLTKTRNDLIPLGECASFAPYDSALLKTMRWSADSSNISFVMMVPGASGVRVDVIKELNYSNCTEPPARVGVEFPSNWFVVKGYNSNPLIEQYSWDGNVMFVFNGFIRNGGYGDLYAFNMETKRANLEINPIDKSCCYRDAQFSPDGSYLVFAYQPISQSNLITLYYIPYGDIGTGARFTPIPLPEGFFPKRDESPQPILRPAAP